jgi:2-amino-4-hydroxy-6-hydroxymethyldihydropteridine diphosphokinase
MMNQSVFLLLGTNLGDRRKNLMDASLAIEARVGAITLRSSIYETDAWGIETQPSFYNQVVALSTFLEASEVLEQVLSIEHTMGRLRNEKWGERIIDIDVLFYGSQIIDTDKLVVPHPEIQNRMFTLVPLEELAPEFLHPKLQRTIRELLDDCADPLSVRKL